MLQGQVAVQPGRQPLDAVDKDAGDAGEPDACASTTVTAEPIPLDLIIVVDRSGSMNEALPAK